MSATVTSQSNQATASTPTEQPVAKKELSISVSEGAAKAIRRQLDKRGTPEASLRVGIRGGGCSGFSYVIEFHDGPPRPKDRVIDAFGVRVVVDPKSLIYLNGTTLEWEHTLMQQGFKFVNPNEKTSCGCGHSFTV
ncbi:MAG: iron-sulfur cluster assembly accessory protein [Polyangiaceae bacterium]